MPMFTKILPDMGSWPILGRFTGDSWTMGLLQYSIIATFANYQKLKQG